MEIATLQSLIAQEKAQAWVIVDYENRNPTVTKLLGEKMLTRKIIMVIPAEGKPFLITHAIDTVYLQDEATLAKFDLKIYHTWPQMLAYEKEFIGAYDTVMMDISEFGLLPRVSLADYGSVEYIKSLGVSIIPSANVLQKIAAVVGDEGLASQKRACDMSLKIKDEAFLFIAKELQEKGYTDELDVQSFIAKRYEEEGMEFDEKPLVAIGKNASDPHYTPTPEAHSQIHMGDLVLIDMWAKFKGRGEVYSDITWMGYCGKEVPAVYQERFALVKKARDGVIDFLKEELPKRDVCGYEADDVARRIITEGGYGEYFIHRVGHNISDDVSPHGPGANLDNYESHDFRRLESGTSFSDEPGIYAPDFGVRSETDLHNQNGKLVVVGGLQDEIIPIMKLLD